MLQFLDEIIQLLKPKLENKKIDLLGEWDENELPRYVLGDKLRLSQILINLMGNAIKFTSVGYVKLIVRKVAEQEKQVRLLFIIKDTGIGISKDKAEHIFDEFQQASADVQVQYGGTGLGLSISKQLVKLQGGELKLKSEPQKGSEFYFELTYDVLDSIDEETENNDVEPVDIDYSKLKLLVAEDNKLNQVLIKKVLQNNNIQCDIANNGQEAVEMYEKNDYDIIFMDINMPKMDGYQATEYIRTKMPESKRSIPIIALSAAVTETERSRAKAAGMNYFLAKPFKEQDIVNLLNKIFSK